MFEGTQNNLGMLSNKIETSIENKEVTPEQLPQGSPIQQEAKQVYDSNPNNDEVNNKAVDDYINMINSSSDERISKYWKPNYETLNNMPSFDFNKPETLTNSDWWKEQISRPKMKYGSNINGTMDLQPGFDYNWDSVLADYPGAYIEGELSPEEIKQNAKKMLIEDAMDEYNKTGDLSILEDYIKEHGKSPVSQVYYDDEYDTDEYKLFSALIDKYPGYFNNVDLSDLQKLLRDKELNKEYEDPITVAMNEGLSEDDPDYFGYNERVKKPIAKTGRRINA